MLIVFGGAFNPPTIAHLNIVKKLLSTYEGSQVLILPVGDDYKKPELIPFNFRVEMLNILFQSMSRVMISPLEKQLGFKGTLAILKELSMAYKDIYWAIGADNLSHLHRWIQYKKLLETYPFIIMTRPHSLSENEANNLFSNVKHHFEFVHINESASSTEVRINPESRKKMLDKKVYQYIIKNHLYEE